MYKDDLRRQIRQIKRQFTPMQLEELSLPIVARLRQRLNDVQTIAAYYPLPDEVNIRPLLDEWIAKGKTVFLPKVTGDDTMELRRYTGHDDMHEGTFHILEPEGQPFAGDVSIDVILVPGVAFDAEGHRLGRGKGYYDRFLSSLGSELIGVCFDFQKVPEVPFGQYDIPVDEVI
ncbi:MAG: 5-formyltetrahydrofolate cyclo-ligase [Prevotella sp.]|nr:5-formyltetrahydrofolate cyclo-ligase [Prevotella sp.]